VPTVINPVFGKTIPPPKTATSPRQADTVLPPFSNNAPTSSQPPENANETSIASQVGTISNGDSTRTSIDLSSGSISDSASVTAGTSSPCPETTGSSSITVKPNVKFAAEPSEDSVGRLGKSPLLSRLAQKNTSLFDVSFFFMFQTTQNSSNSFVHIQTTHSYRAKSVSFSHGDLPAVQISVQRKIEATPEQLTELKKEWYDSF
jgi:hypothetical protein